jgi:hypothetical protein
MLTKGQVVCDGMDSDFTYWRVGSFSRVGLEHSVHIDNRTGYLHCSCEDYTMRRRKAFFMDELGIGGCRHCKVICRLVALIRSET